MTPDVPPMPPYAHLGAAEVSCIASATARYAVPELLLHAVLLKENGRTGQQVRNNNGSHDLGLSQINTIWLSFFEAYGMTKEMIRDNACLNIHIGAYILRRYYAQHHDWGRAIVSYNIGPSNWTSERYAIGHRYATDVIARWHALENWRKTAAARLAATAPASVEQDERVFSAPRSQPSP